jgi:L-lactate dehydrogenase complex protein LldG
MLTERNYHMHTSQSHEEVVQLFVSRLEDYNAGVHRIRETEISDTVAKLLKKYSLNQLVIPADIPPAWVPAELAALRDVQNQLTNDQMGESNSAVLTACAVAIAQTGTIVLDGGPLQGRRVLSLLPDYAICIVREDQVVGLVPEAVAYLNNTITQHHQPITFISGPSATSDIELSRVVGVHGPRHLDILLIF